MWFVHNPASSHLPRHALRCERPDQSRHSRQQTVHLLRAQISLRRIKGEVPQTITSFLSAKANIVREGRDVSVITYAAMVHSALEAAEILAKENIEIEILDLRSLVPSIAKPSPQR